MDPLTLPPLDDLISRAHVVALPMRIRFRGVGVREALLFDGTTAWSEFAPFVEYDAPEASRWLRSSLLMGFSDSLGPAARETVAVNATIPAVDVDQDPGVIDRLMQRYPGCTTVKIKVAEKGQHLGQDLARIRAVKQWFMDNDEVTEHPAIRLDANGGWDVSTAIEAVEAVVASHIKIDYLEQPCPSADELAELRRQLMRRGLFVRVAADEAIRKSADPRVAVREVVDAGACDVVVLKVPPLGGVDVLLDIAAEVGRRGVAVTVSSALDTAVGLGAGLAAAARLPALDDDDGMMVDPQAAGLATGTLFERDLAARPIVDGRMVVGPVVPDAQVLKECTVTGERRDWWLDRVRECYRVLEG